MDLDLALRIEQPPSSIDSSSSEVKKFYEKWEHSNCMSFMIIKCHAPIPGPTRLADPNRFRGVRPYTRTLYFSFFSELNLYLWVYKQFL